jgi:hypothetical protein
MKMPNKPWKWVGILAGVVLVGVAPGMAQQMVLPTHEVPSPDVASEVLQRDRARQGVVKLGPFDIIPRIQSSFYYNDNVGTDPTDETDALVFTLAPSIEAVASDMEQGMGKRLRIDYTPAFIWYFSEDDTERDKANHLALISGDVGGAKLSLGFDQRFRFTTGPVLDIGTRANRTESGTRLRSNLILGEKTALQVNGSISFVEYDSDEYTSSYDLSTDDWLMYRYSPKLDLGLGLVFGYTGIEDLPDQTYQQALARADYAIAEKVDLRANVGGEWRQFKSGIDDALNPVWNLTAEYRPRESTFLSMSVFQRYSSSSRSGNQSYINTGVSFSARQKLMQRLALNLSVAYSNSDYETTASGAQTDRNDDNFRFRGSIDYYIMQRWTVGAFYDFATRDSTDPDLNYDRNQVGLQTAWTY